MSDEKHEELIIVRRHEEEDHEAHSSAWKVAHADFMTAMMAFFLIMWLINVTDEEVKKSIANYFNPVKLSASVTDRKGLNDPEDVSPQGPEAPGDEKTTLHPGPQTDMAEAGAGDAADEAEHAAEGGDEAAADHQAEAASGAGEAGEHGEASPAEAAGAEAAAEHASADTAAAAAEHAAFRDPYAVLAELASEVPEPETSADAVAGEAGVAALPGNEVARDPFDPVYWLMEQGGGLRSEAPASEGRADAPPRQGLPDVRAPRQAEDDATAGTTAEAVPDAMDEALPQEPETAAHAAAVAADAAPATAAAERAADLERTIGAALKERLGGQDAPKVEIRATEEGILISLTDDIDFSMFAIGSAIPRPTAVVAMDEIARALTTMPGDIVLRGHTDARPFRSDTYDNWRLSTARAHMAYYMLTRNTLDEGRIRTVEGFADRQLKAVGDPYAPENRRIEILLKEPSV